MRLRAPQTASCFETLSRDHHVSRGIGELWRATGNILGHCKNHLDDEPFGIRPGICPKIAGAIIPYSCVAEGTVIECSLKEHSAKQNGKRTIHARRHA